MSAALSSFLPEQKGVLPYFMLLLSVVSVGNSIQNYFTLHYTRRIYNGRFLPNQTLSPATASYNPEDAVDKLVPTTQDDPKGSDQCTPLVARCFGTWTLITAIIRLYAAYHLSLEPIYNIAYWTYVIAFLHFSTELFIFKSMTFGLPQFFPFLVSTSALVWMPLVKGHYVS